MKLLSLKSPLSVFLLGSVTLIVTLGADSAKLQVGDKAPDFTANAAQDKSLSLSDFQGKKSVVLVFNRAHW